MSRWFKKRSRAKSAHRTNVRRTTHRLEWLEARLPLAGDFGFAVGLGSTNQDGGNAVVTDAAGNVYIAGRFSGSVDFDPGPGNTTLVGAGADIFVAKFDKFGSFVWAKAMGGAGFDQATSLAVDAAGNVYLTGTFQGTADFDPSSNVFNITSDSGSTDIFLAKLDSAGSLLVARAIGGPGTDQAASLTLDTANNVLVAGSFHGSVDFDPGPNITTLTSNGVDDAFVAKFTTNIGFTWAHSVGDTGVDQANGVAVDGLGNVYAVGVYQGTVDFNPATAAFGLTSAGSNDAFVLKLDAAGNFVWARSLGGTGSDQAFSIAADRYGNTAVAGIFQGTADFDPGAGTRNLISAGDDDAFLAKLSADGNLFWAYGFGGAGIESARSTALDAAGNVYVTGFFQGTVDFDPGPATNSRTSAGSEDVFVSKFAPSGVFIRGAALGGATSDEGFGVAADVAGNVYTTGTFTGTADFDPGAANAPLTSNGSEDIFISKLIQPASIFATGADAGGGPHVRVFNAISQTERFSLFPYATSFTGGVRVATGDVNGDGTPDVITAPGPGGGPHVRVFDGRTGAQLPGAIGSFFAYASSVTTGLFVASADVDHDGKADVITAPDAGGGPHVRVFSGADGHELASFFAYDSSFTGGVRVAVGDVNHDGHADIITAAGPGGGPHVRVFSGANVATQLASFFAFSTSFTGGVYVAGGDLTGDGNADIVVGAGPGGTPNVRVFNGTNSSLITSFLAYDAAFSGGVRVAAPDVDGDVLADIVTGPGRGGGPDVRAFKGGGTQLASFFAYASNFTGGVFVGGNFQVTTAPLSGVMAPPSGTGAMTVAAPATADAPSQVTSSLSGSDHTFTGAPISQMSSSASNVETDDVIGLLAQESVQSGQAPQQSTRDDMFEQSEWL